MSSTPPKKIFWIRPCIASTLFTCCFEASNQPIFHSQPVCYLYVLPVRYIHAASKLRTSQSSIPSQYAIYTYCKYAIYMLLRTTQFSIPGQYAIYTYCQYAIYMLLRSFEPPNLPFLASMLSIRIASMLFTCCFEASNYLIFHSGTVCYLYVLPVWYLHAASKLRTTQPTIPGLYAIYTYCQYGIYMLLRTQYAIYMLLRTTQFSIPGQYVIYTYCQYAIYMRLRSFEPPNLTFLASMLSIRIASMLFTCCFEASNHTIFHSQPVSYLYVLPVCYLRTASKHQTTQSSIPGLYASYIYCQYAIYMLLRSFEPPNFPFLASMLSIYIASMPFTCCFEDSNHQIFHSQPVSYLYVLPVCYLRTASNHPIFHSRPVCYLYVLPVCYLHAASKHRTTQSSIPGLYANYTYCQYAIYMLLRSIEPPNLPLPACMLSIRIASMVFTWCFEPSNHPTFHSRPVCYLYVLPVWYLHAASNLRTSQFSIPGLYAIYTYCKYAIYMLLQSIEPPNLPFPASMLSIRIASMLFTCCFEASNHPTFHSRPVCYLYVLPVWYLHAASNLRTSQFSIPGLYAIYTYCQYAIYMLLRSFEPPNLPFPASMLSIRIASMLFTCCFEASNLPIFLSWPVCYLYVLAVCYLHAASKHRTTQSSIPGLYAIYTYCQYAIYMLLRTTQFSIPGLYAIYTYCQYAMYMILRNFELPNLPFLASMLSIRIASMLFTCCFEASNLPIFHSRSVCYLYVLPVWYLHAASKHQTTQSSIPGLYASYIYCQYAIYMLLRSFEPPNFPFLASMLSIYIASMPFTCCFEDSNHPIFHSWPVCYLYVLPVCYLHAASKLRTSQSSFHGLYAIYTYCQYAIYMLLRSFEVPNLSFMSSMLSIRTPVCHLHAASKLRTTQPSIPSQYAIYTYCQYAIYMLLRSFEPPNLPFPASMLSIRIASMLFTCCFEASSLPISILSQYAIYSNTAGTAHHMSSGCLWQLNTSLINL